MKSKVAGCLAVALLFAGAITAAICGLRKIGEILDSISITRDDMIM